MTGAPATDVTDGGDRSADGPTDRRGDRWADAMLAARLLAVDPVGLGGVSLHAPPGPVRDLWLTLMRDLLPDGAPVRRVPAGIPDGSLLGGLDLTATLRAGRPVVGRGVLAAADGGLVVLSMAERICPGTAARVAAVLDAGEVRIERDGIALSVPTRIGVVALDEGLDADERPPDCLTDRLAFRLDLGGVPTAAAVAPASDGKAVKTARDRLRHVIAGDDAAAALCSAAWALGIDSLRAPLLALKVARAAAALDGRLLVETADLALAARLVLAPRATRLPAAEAEDAAEDAPPPGDGPEADADPADPQGAAADVVLAAAQAAIPPGLLARLAVERLTGGARRNGGKAGADAAGAGRGRTVGTRRGEPSRGLHLNLIETLRAAAPWQRLRGDRVAGGPVVSVVRDDFRVDRIRRRSRTATIFVVDASGSAAMQRLAEAKGAVEMLLADCYVRRDEVALLAFRGRGAELLLPPTRSLCRAKRSLSALPGGGGTPLACGIDAALELADAVRRRGASPSVVLLTDGRANVARDGTQGRARAGEDALAAARRLFLAGIPALLVDTSARPEPAAHRLAGEMRALYLPLPHADPAALSGVVRAMAPGRGGPAPARA